MGKENFVKADPELSRGTSKIVNSDLKIGEFLSRVWGNFGPPDSVEFEGFSYTFQHVPSGLIFTAYAAGSGPAYGGKKEEQEKLQSIIEEFNKLLQESSLVDCEIEFDSDYGMVKVGVKDGKAFETSEEE